MTFENSRKIIGVTFATIALSLFSFSPLFAQQTTTEVVTNAVTAAAETAGAQAAHAFVAPAETSLPGQMSSGEFLKKAWEFSGKNDLAGLIKLVDDCLAIYGEKAAEQQASLSDFPMRGKENEVSVLNDIGTMEFVKAEALMNNGKTDEAVAEFQKIIKEFSYAQAWDPSRGAFWSIKDKSQASIDVIQGNVVDEEPVADSLRTVPPLLNPGSEKVIDYRKYGQFSAVGTKDYKYIPSKPKELTAAVGYGIYPSNTTSILKSPEYLKVKQEGRLEGSHWDFLLSTDLEAAYFKWINAPEPTGIRLFYQGLIFERAKMYYEALKAYHSLVVYFPNTVAWTYWQTPWYPAQAAVSKIQHIIRINPELNLSSQWMKIEITNGFDNDVTNDSVTTWPGVIKEKVASDRFKDKMNLGNKNKPLGKVKRTLGTGRVQLMQYENKHWKMFVDDKPFVIKGMTYAPTKIGQSPDKNTLASWMEEDTNENGILDGPYEAWVDANRNDKRDVDEPIVGDFAIMKEMGVNTIREYYQPFKPVKEVLRKMHKDYGFMVIMGNFLGKYTHGSGAGWFEGTNYSNPIHQENMMKSVREMVMELKDEPYILMWLLGNENNYGVANNADKDPTAYYKFVNDVAKMIHEIDPNHPVAICSGDTLFLDIFAKNAPEVDIFGANVYRGDYGFGSFWEQVAGATDKPAFITEYGSPAYTTHLSLEEGETEQANYHHGNWLDIDANLGGRPDSVGNSLGGVAFEWLDEWWKNYEPYRHDKKSEAIGPFAGGYYFEEWFGIHGQGKGKHSPFMRQPRKVYQLYKEMWKSKP